MTVTHLHRQVPSPVVAPWINKWASSRYILWLLIAAGVARTIVLFMAYPPAHGPDSLAYFLYSERLAGQDFPMLARLVPPLYSYFILITFKGLGSVYWLIALQACMAITIAPLYYLSLRRYSPVLAVLASLVIVADVQGAIVFNFTSTEPLYTFLLALLVYTITAAFEHWNARETRSWWQAFLMVGVLVGLLFLTRPVAKFMVVPVVLVAWIVTRRWQPAAVTTAGFVIVVALHSVFSLMVVGQVEGLSAGMYMALKPTVVIEQAQVENGDLIDSPLADCETGVDTCLTESISLSPGNSATRADVYQTTFIWERVRAFLFGEQFGNYVMRMVNGTLDFLALSGQQYGYDPDLPGDVQCAGADTQPDGITTEWLESSHMRWALPYDDDILPTLRTIVPPITTALCPPLKNAPVARSLVDYVALHYRSLARPRNQLALWYGGVFLLALIIPTARRWLPLLLSLFTLLIYHALISAVALNVQPRYVVVTNPFRAILLVSAVCLAVQGAVVLAQRIQSARQKNSRS